MAVLAYAFPAKDENKFKAYVFPYVYPYFHQDWSMFAPIPKQNYTIYVRYDGHDWYDVFNEVVMAHQNNRFSGHENISISLSSAIRYYASSIESANTYKVDDGSNVNLKVIEKILIKYISKKDGTAPKNMETIIRIRDVDGSADHSHYYLN